LRFPRSFVSLRDRTKRETNVSGWGKSGDFVPVAFQAERGRKMSDTLDVMDGPLPNLWQPPPDKNSRSPAAGDHGASGKNSDQLGGSIENRNTVADQNIQAATCEHCGESFQPRKWTGGKPQRFCSTEYRKAFHAGAIPNVPDVSDVGPNSPTLAPTFRAPHGSEGGEFDWASDDVDIVLREQHATAIHFNRSDGIRQRCWPDGDHYVIISKNNVDSFLDRLIDACGIQTFDGPPPKPAPRRS
jgi:hypothetical protein